MHNEDKEAIFVLFSSTATLTVDYYSLERAPIQSLFVNFQNYCNGNKNETGGNPNKHSHLVAGSEFPLQSVHKAES
jgi:hypothetical protein